MNNEFLKRFLSSIIILPITFFIVINGSKLFVFFLIFLFLLTSYEWIKMIKKNLLNKIVGLLFFLISYYSAFQLREIYGFELFIFILSVCIFTDLGGYFFGKFFKGPKLTKISPKKTYAGVIGSFVFPLLFYFVYNTFTNLNFKEIFHLDLILLILVISVISQFGDLIISYFKRVAKIKDTGKVLPGHGGILDRIDGIIFVIPILYYLTKL